MYFWDSQYRQFVSQEKPVNRFVYSYGCVKIRDIAEHSGELSNIVKQAIGNICAWFGRRKSITEDDARMIAKDVYYKHGHAISVFGVLHAFNLMEEKADPCDIEMFGFKVEDVSRCFSRYTNHCKHEYLNYLVGLEEKSSLAANMAGLAGAMDKAPQHIKESLEEMRQKQEARDQLLKRPFITEEQHEKNVIALIEKGVLVPANPTANDFD